jgi:hypothetical protein
MVPAPRHPEPERPHFDMVLRGYDRIEVDQYVAELLEENAALRRELNGRPPPAEPGERPAPGTAAPATQQYDVETPAEDSFGFRAEKLLRLAERESAEMRTRATRDAEAVEASARRRGEEMLRTAEKEADDVRARAAQEAARLKKQAAQESARLSHLHRNTKGELRRLAQVLNAELERPDPDGEPAETPGAVRPAPAPHDAGTPASNP